MLKYLCKAVSRHITEHHLFAVRYITGVCSSAFSVAWNLQLDRLYDLTHSFDSFWNDLKLLLSQSASVYNAL